MENSPQKYNRWSKFTKSLSSDYLITTAVSTSSTSDKIGALGSIFDEEKSSHLHLKYHETSMKIDKETTGERSPISASEIEKSCRTSIEEVGPESSQVLLSEKYNDWRDTEEWFKNSICTICEIGIQRLDG